MIARLQLSPEEAALYGPQRHEFDRAAFGVALRALDRSLENLTERAVDIGRLFKATAEELAYLEEAMRTIRGLIAPITAPRENGR